MDEELFTKDSPKKSTRRRVEPENTTKEKSMGDKLKNETSAADSYRKKLRHKQSNVKEGKTTPPKMFTDVIHFESRQWKYSKCKGAG